MTINVVLNTAPEFASTSTSRSVVEDGQVGTNVGSPVTATDADQGDTLTYTLGGADADSFSINSSSGQISTAAVLDYETKSPATRSRSRPPTAADRHRHDCGDHQCHRCHRRDLWLRDEAAPMSGRDRTPAWCRDCEALLGRRATSWRMAARGY